MTVTRCAVVPAYNAAKRLPQTLDGLLPYVDQIIVVDDGSSDDTALVAQRHERIRVISQRRQGPGGAVFTGLKSAKKLGAEWAVVVDADGQMEAERIPVLFDLLESSDVDLVRGSRLEPESGGDSMPLLRYAAGRILALPSSWSARSSIRDPLSGFVALRLSKLPNTLWRGFGYPMHLSAAIAAAGGRIEHVAVPAYYPHDGVSHHGLHRAPAIFIALMMSVKARLR
jgi:glycosyltransferase involved in cell wall biosynthesis